MPKFGATRVSLLRITIALGLGVGFLLGLPACNRSGKLAAPVPVTISGPLVQRAYVWQRDWSRQVSQAVAGHATAFDSLALLAAQMEWRDPSKPPTIIRPAIDWTTLHATGKSIGLVVRVHRAGEPDTVAEAVTKLLNDRLAEAAAANVSISEMQIDYDCPQKSLDAYLRWFTKVRETLRPTRIPLRLTALPTWLGEPTFAALADASDGYILQVHSFDVTKLGKTPTVCDPAAANTWIGRAAKLGRPFWVALPTYRCLAGYAPDGSSLGMAADAGSPTWPPGTTVIELTSDADALSSLVASWTANRPATMQGLYWYRLPIVGESRNWHWSTLAAVMAGRTPLSRWEIRATADNPTDFTLCNTGEKDEPRPRIIRITWPGPERIAAADSLGGWRCQFEPDRIIYQYPQNGSPGRVYPGASIPLGWIRFRETPSTVIPFSHEIVR